MPDVGRNEPLGAASCDPPPSIARELALAQRAARQHGVVGRDQLVALGLSRDEVQQVVRCGRLTRIHPGVYAVGAQPLSQRGRWFAALLASRPDPLLSHLSSAAEIGIARERGPVHVAVAARGGRRLAGAVVHRCRFIDPADRSRRNGLPVTTVERTLLDLAETETADRFERIAEEADRHRLLDPDRLRAVVARNPGRHGARRVLELLEHFVSSPDANEGIERQFHVLLREEGLPMPQANVLVHGQIVDCWWPQSRFVVELDSHTHHSHWMARERDLVRDANLLRLGIATLRVTARRMRKERPELVADLRAGTGRTQPLR